MEIGQKLKDGKFSTLDIYIYISVLHMKSLHMGGAGRRLLFQNRFKKMKLLKSSCVVCNSNFMAYLNIFALITKVINQTS